MSDSPTKRGSSSTETCAACGDTGSVRVYSHEDYGVSFECEYCEECDYGRSLIAADQAAWDDHDAAEHQQDGSDG